MYLSAHGAREGKLLEVGCGSGDMLKLMQELGWHVEGVDFDHKAVENAQRKGLHVSHGALEAQAYPDNHFDAITMSHVIEHVPDPVLLLSECYRILSPGGRVVIVTPNSDSWGHAKFASSWRGLEPPRHLHVFNPQSFTILSQKVGFRILKVFTTIRNANAQFIASRSLRLTGKHAWGSSQPWTVRKWGKIMMFIEWGILKKSPFSGEEIVLILGK
jgi:ubiquinone/menaquinone biosynthesis C-methylase UbiE